MNRERSLFQGIPVLGPAGNRRLWGLTILLVLAFGGLIVRLVQLQVIRSEELSERAQNRRFSTWVSVGLRGKVMDSRRVLLAASDSAKTVYAEPHNVGTNAVLLARVLQPFLGMPEEQLVRLLRPRMRIGRKGKPVPVQYVVLRRRVPEATWEQMRQALRNLPLGEHDPSLPPPERRRRERWKKSLLSAIHVEPVDTQIRRYPCGALAAHVLGFTGILESTNGPWAGDIEGREGIESSLDPVLRGARGWREVQRVIRDRTAVYEAGEEVAARPGLNVVLTIDANLQRIAEAELQAACDRHSPKGASCVMVRPATGEILALANYPTFDPNRPGEASADARRNRAIADMHEPGSTFKVVTIAGALDAGVVRLDEPIDCQQGSFLFWGERLSDVHPSGVLSVLMVVAKSSNIGAAKVGIRMGPPLLYESVRRFGLGELTGIPLPGERSGLVWPTNRWSKISVAWIPMGHEVATTPLQMTMAVAAVANGGRLMRPMLVKQVEDDNGRVVRTAQPLVRRQVIREETARQMVAALKTAVESGTGVRAQLEHYPVAGKTGTAQKVVNGAYVHDRHFASFVGFFPADDPQLCIGVFLDEPKKGRYGGETAAPVFQAMARQAAGYMGIPPVRPAEESPVPPGETLAGRGSLRVAAGAGRTRM